ncbi:MAG: hypothetical protein MPW15_19255 [Candidatus Manganitrophus sp.]|nr:hypothetical protein [Candidatus Manganitrophus sp.]
MVFLPPPPPIAAPARRSLRRVIAEEGQRFLGWRDVPTKEDHIGEVARQTVPAIRQIFIARNSLNETEFERKLYVIRKRVENAVRQSAIAERKYFYVPSLSCNTIIYKGLLLPSQIPLFYPDLADAQVVSALALVHSRFSTNTFPSVGPLAHPYRYIAHNGEINTLRGNVNWMRAREGRLSSELFGDDLEKLFPIIDEHQTDSACFDNALELLVMGGRSLPHAMMMMIPEAWAGNPDDGSRPARLLRVPRRHDGAVGRPGRRGLHRRPADRRHARPQRPAPRALPRHRRRPGGHGLRGRRAPISAGRDPDQKWRLQPGKMFLIDTDQGRIIDDQEIKADICRRKPYRHWIMANRINLDDLPEPLNLLQPDHITLLQRQQAFGYTQEDLKLLLTPMAVNGEEPIGSMGTDTPLAVLSDRPQLLYNYFKQLFAQVTNPPIDPIREELVMSLVTIIGPKPNLLGETPEHARRIRVQQPILTNADLEKMRTIADGHFQTQTLRMLYPAAEGADRPRGRAGAALPRGRRRDPGRIQHHHPVRPRRRRGARADPGPAGDLGRAPPPDPPGVHPHRGRVVVETGEPREVHHFACLVGYGAGAVNPYLAFETLADMVAGRLLSPRRSMSRPPRQEYIKAISKGLLKVMSKMGISTFQSYCGAQIFEAVGLNSELVDKYFTGTATRIDGIGLAALAEEVLRRHSQAPELTPNQQLDAGGEYHWRIRRRAAHLEARNDREAAARDAHDSYATFKEYSRAGQ